MGKADTEQLVRLLRSHPRAGSDLLCRLMGGINRSTLARMLQALGDSVVRRGGSRRIRYALRRSLRGKAGGIPLFAIDETGAGREIALLDLTQPQGSALAYAEAFAWPVEGDTADGWFEGLPYPLIDMRPQGFIGRNFARRHALDLGVAENPDLWSEDDLTQVLASHGHDQPGNLLLGEAAFRRMLEGRRSGGSPPLADAEIEAAYPQLAADALAYGLAASSAGGEFPKFTAARRMGEHVQAVIVKFSGAGDTPAERRWSDLLVCEHLAARILAPELGVDAAPSTVHRFAGRSFLEVQRFDRHGEFGRSAVCTLASLNPALLGLSAPWPKLAEALQRRGCLAGADVEKIARLWWFGRLIANSDMHDGNLAFRPGLSLAPAYDMLPMAYAPLRGGELPAYTYQPELPLPREAQTWRQAAAAAQTYWQRCADDTRISADFRRQCESNAQSLQRLPAP
ncbi:MAG: type II toxin-antitoxin system HipA family toxin YjjJ [Rhodocyclaceae bacterium]|nr:type II toxin-antitoxin system HipA family toxin YjjJ [Rhodocyclaceae bacterium]MBX3667313.1 type II toxin-antitoxin system HipA family toxin YjjJ [Rhodocyclaceae bacterium]